MTIEKNIYSHLLRVMHNTTAPNWQFARMERALAITVVVLLLLASCTFAQVGAFASFAYSHVIGFSCIGLSAFIALIKGLLLSLHCCNSYITIHARTRYTLRGGASLLTEEAQRNAIGS